MYSPSLSMHTWFNYYMLECPHIVRQICHSAVSSSHNTDNDVIFHPGEQSTFMLTCRRGRMRYKYGPDGAQRHADVEIGTWLAEPCLWCHWVHRGVLRAVEE